MILNKICTVVNSLPDLLVVVLVVSICHGQDVRTHKAGVELITIGYVAEQGGDCARLNTVLVGSMIELAITAFPGLESEKKLFFQIPIKTGRWPEGLVLEAGFLRPQFVVEPGLIDRMKPMHYLSYAQIHWYSDKDSINVSWQDMATRHFLLTIPQDLAGDTVYFKVHWNIQGLGEGERVCYPLILSAPCSSDDSAKILGSHIENYLLASDYAKSIFLADSMIQRGWTDPVGLLAAYGSADHLHQYEKALNYLNALFSAKGYIEKPMYRSWVNDPEWLAKQREFYEGAKAQMEAKIHEQQY